MVEDSNYTTSSERQIDKETEAKHNLIHGGNESLSKCVGWNVIMDGTSFGITLTPRWTRASH